MENLRINYFAKSKIKSTVLMKMSQFMVVSIYSTIVVDLREGRSRTMDRNFTILLHPASTYSSVVMITRPDIVIHFASIVYTDVHASA